MKTGIPGYFKGCNINTAENQKGNIGVSLFFRPVQCLPYGGKGMIK
jgi:hypothetical protein